MCGIAGIIPFKKIKNKKLNINKLNDYIDRIKETVEDLSVTRPNITNYLGGKKLLNSFLIKTGELKLQNQFYALYTDGAEIKKIEKIAEQLDNIITSQTNFFLKKDFGFAKKDAEKIYSALFKLKDIRWALTSELIDNINKVKKLITYNNNPTSIQVAAFKNINTVLNSIDRLEVRGRDSAGISVIFTYNKKKFKKFQLLLTSEEKKQLNKRTETKQLLNGSINANTSSDNKTSITFTYKIAAEVGKLGDNVKFLRKEIIKDNILQKAGAVQYLYNSIISHTRWASVGGINEFNCHPIDLYLTDTKNKNQNINVCLNGDIDNYIRLKTEFENNGEKIDSDTKIIPLLIKKYLKKTSDIKEAFRLAVNNFKGSHAIAMHTDLAPGKIFLAQKGSGQALFIGIADEHYIPASEVYGFVEDTRYFIKINCEQSQKIKNKEIEGQIFILDSDKGGKLNGITASYYDGEKIKLNEKFIKQTEITSRDIDRRDYAHYFLKEISESPASVEKTLLNRLKTDKQQKRVTLDKKAFPQTLKKAFLKNKIKKIYFVGQGTAGVAAVCGANILRYYLSKASIQIRAVKASELSGFILFENDDKESLKDTLVVAVTQSGTTTDTNKTVDMAKERGGWTIAIVNRRDSDITFKTDGVLYTSSGRDIEMSVASTKAFYSQVAAAALLGLCITSAVGIREEKFIRKEIKRLIEIPNSMRKILATKDKIKKSAEKFALFKTYWAVVGSGANKPAADEIRIKLSELCYKTISSDYIEDKKHIDLSAEPLIIVCAASARENVIQDIVKDTAIFKAHKATPIVITDEKEHRFDAYAEDVFYIPTVSQHFAPILNTLAGHLWGYFAALAINGVSEYLYQFKEDIKNTVDNFVKQGLDIYEIVQKEEFKEKITLFSIDFKQKKADKQFPSIIGFKTASDLTLLLKYLSGKLDVSDFTFDFDIEYSALNMLQLLLKRLNGAINRLSRPIDAIRHQAKTVTVGTSRISDKIEGVIFEEIEKLGIKLYGITAKNILVLKNLQKIISGIRGYILYKIDGLNINGKPCDASTITVLEKGGALFMLPSRVEKDSRLRGTKKTIVERENVYIAKARLDGRNIIIIPIISTNPQIPNKIEYLLLFNITFKEEVPLEVKIKALGPKFQFIKNIVQESVNDWKDEYINMVPMYDLFGKTAEKTGELIISIISMMK
ncbi:MAG: SIS domain-containing protein [Deltaproteobacteria bacterium]|nr:SIS domain-containing protein [Deltaproteobacteria bacterium]